MDAPIGVIFSWFPLEAERAFLPACDEEEGDAVPESADDGEADDVRRTESEPVASPRAGEEAILKFEGKAVGSIHERLQYWVDNFGPDSYVRGILAEGYQIPVDWSKIPESYEEPDNKSAKDNYDFVREEVARLVEGGQVVEQQLRPRCVNPLTVAIKTNADGGKKRRLVLDLSRAVNLAL
jgi:hypothetical protein